MLKLPSTELIALIEDVLTKHQWTQSRLAAELNIGPEAISRWRGGTGIHKGHYEELKNLLKDPEAKLQIAKSPQISIPSTLTISRDTLKISMDKDGNFIVKGIMEGTLNKEGNNGMD